MEGQKGGSPTPIPVNNKASEEVGSPPSSTPPIHARSAANTSTTRPRSFSMSKIVVSSPVLPFNQGDGTSQNRAQCSGLPVWQPEPDGVSSCKNDPELVQKEPLSGYALEHQISSTERWDITIKRAIKGIVSIKATTLRSFDTESAGSYTATGFVVDKTRG